MPLSKETSAQVVSPEASTGAPKVAQVNAPALKTVEQITPPPPIIRSNNLSRGARKKIRKQRNVVADPLALMYMFDPETPLKGYTDEQVEKFKKALNEGVSESEKRIKNTSAATLQAQRKKNITLTNNNIGLNRLFNTNAPKNVSTKKKW
jgi:hypothetical protein